jgi:hypothetical protein
VSAALFDSGIGLTLLDSISAVNETKAETKPALITELSAKFPTATKVSIDQLLKEHVKKQSGKEGTSWKVDEAFVSRILVLNLAGVDAALQSAKNHRTDEDVEMLSS